MRVDSRSIALIAIAQTTPSFHSAEAGTDGDLVATNIILLGVIGLHVHRELAGDFRRDLNRRDPTIRWPP